MRVLFISLSDMAEKQSELAGLGDNLSSSRVFDVALSRIKAVNGSPFAYWLPTEVVHLFSDGSRFESDSRRVRTTNPVGENNRFVRLNWEVSTRNWRPWAKGSTKKFYSDLDHVISWDSVRNTYRGFLGTKYRPMERPASVDLFGKSGITWPLRARRFSPSALPRGAIHSVRSFLLWADPDELLWLLGLCASEVVDFLFKTMLGRAEYPEFIVSTLQAIPYPPATSDSRLRVAQFARAAWSRTRTIASSLETSKAFSRPDVLKSPTRQTLRGAINSATATASLLLNEVEELQVDIDLEIRRQYGLEGVPLRIQGLVVGPADDESTEEDDSQSSDDEIATLASWAAGVSLGRFDLRLATGERQPPLEPDPFDPLPVCSPGMLTGDDGLPLDAPPPGYAIDFPRAGILIDDPGHPDDLVDRCRAVFGQVFGADADARWHEAAELLGERDLRDWFRRSFFEFHLKRYSKSRRKAPIYWPLSTPSGAWTLWLYYPRLTKDTFFKALQDQVGPKLKREETRLNELDLEGGASPLPNQLIKINAQRAFVTELTVFKQDLEKLIAPLWKPDLDDGVIINFAPLWRFVSHKTWQKELKATWESLCNREYDWSHLAMHLWPEHVVPKCKTDRSLAIAHGLEAELWLEGKDGKWTPRPTDATTLQRLITERSSQAVQRARDALIAAPAPTTTRAAPVAKAPKAPKAPKPARPSTPRAPPATTAAGDAFLEVRALLSQQPQGLSKADLISQTHLPEAQVTTILKTLLDNGIVTKTGASRGTRYVPAAPSESGN